MNYSLLIEDRFGTKKIFECRDITQSVSFTTNRTSSPGVLKFELLKSGDISFQEGDPVRFTVDGTPVFYGYVFTKEKTRWGEISVTCYDQLRYLKANQSYSFVGMTAGDIIRQIAKDFNLKVGTIEDTGYKIPSLVCNNKECLDSISKAVQITTVNTKKVFVFFDDSGLLTLREAAGMKQGVVLGDKSLVTDYTYTTDIDKDTYNLIKLVRPNEETGKGDVYESKDSGTIGRWGLLQYYDVVDEQMNPAQIQSQAKTMLAYYNRTLRTLKLECLGVPGLRAGQMVFINIPELGDISLSKYAMLERVEHSFENESHTMQIETRALNDGTN